MWRRSGAVHGRGPDGQRTAVPELRKPPRPAADGLFGALRVRPGPAPPDGPCRHGEGRALGWLEKAHAGLAQGGPAA
jgi:hypothetical protein